MWQFSIFIGNRRKHKTTDIWRCAYEDQCVPDKTGCLSDNNSKRSACKAGLLMLRMSVKLTRVTRVVLPNNLYEGHPAAILYRMAEIESWVWKLHLVPCLSRADELTHWGLVTPYGDKDLGRHWLRYWLVAWRHQVITWTNVDLSLVRSSDIHIRASSQEVPEPSITEIIWKIKYLKFHSNFPGANELSTPVPLSPEAGKSMLNSLWQQMLRRHSAKSHQRLQ